MIHKYTRRGFTLIELLVVIGILAILLAITLIAINPARQFAQSNNTKRSSDVNAILNSINQYMADNKGALPPPTTGTGITSTPASISNAGVDICAAIVPTYIAALPVDPLTNNGTPVSNCAQVGGYDSNYWIAVDASGSNRLTVTAPAAELGAVIAVTR